MIHSYHFHSVIVLSLVASFTPAYAEDAATLERRLSRTVGLLASDQMAGRGLGTPEIDQVAEYIRGQFAAIGLATTAVDGSAFQSFDYTLAAKLAGDNHAAFTNSATGARMALALGKQYQPLAIGGAGEFDLPLVFAGYGITAPEAEYDDYRGIDARSKAVIVLRHEPQQANPHSAFNGTDHSEHAPFRSKVRNAIDHGAAAILFCTDKHEINLRISEWRRRREAVAAELTELNEDFSQLADPSQDQTEEHRQNVEQLSEKLVDYARRQDSQRDALMPFEGAGASNEEGRLPVLFCNRASLDVLLAHAGKPSLETLERQIDEAPAPHSFELDGWRIRGKVAIDRDEVVLKNVIGVLEGEGPLAEESVIVGAHYDHLGRGGFNSAAPGVDEIHNGADDNASGVAALLEVARYFTTQPTKPKRRLVFIAFTGEERGLLGSAYYVNHPLFPLESTVAMINFDMVGRMRDNKFIVNGSDTAEQFAGWIDQVNERHGFDVSKVPGGFGPSDHASYYGKQIPVLHLFTGLHAEYHRPNDDIELLNLPGMRRVCEFSCEMVELVANSPERPTYVESTARSQLEGPRDPRPYFGSIPDFSQSGSGYAITGVAPGSPSADGGLQGGDLIVRFADMQIKNLEDFDAALRKFEAGDKVPVVVVRDGAELTLEVVLDPPR